MNTSDSTDLISLLGDVFKKEDMVAFFEFSHEVSNQEVVSGLCRISRPKKGDSNLNYIALTFVLDTPDLATVNSFTAIAKKFRTDNLSRYLDTVKSTMLLPPISPSHALSIREVEIVFQEGSVLDREFILDWLYPTILSITKFKSQDIIFCDSGQNDFSNQEQLNAEEQKGSSLIKRITSLLKK